MHFDDVGELTLTTNQLPSQPFSTVHPLNPAAMAHDHSDSPKPFGIRLREDTMKLVSEIQYFRQRTNQPLFFASIVEDAIQCHYNRLQKEGAIPDA